MKTLFEKYQNAKYATRVGKICFSERVLKGLSAKIYARKINNIMFDHAPKDLPPALNPESEFIVSLTSFPKRINTVWMVIDCMMRQTIRPSEIQLNLYEGEFPGKDADLPENLKPYLQLGLKLRFTSENLMSHLKYYYTMSDEKSGKQRPVITVDDDLFYAPDTVERLIGLHKKYPEAIAGNICKRIKNNTYSSWEIIVHPEGPSSDIIALGFGAVLYPPSFYCSSLELFNIEKIKNLCLRADDLWLKHCELLNGTDTVTGDYFAIPPMINGSQTIALSHSNINKNRNDFYWATLVNLKK